MTGKSRVPLIFGTMTLGAPGKSGVRNDTIEEAKTIVDTFLKAGYTELDTARLYAEGTTEDYLRQLDLPKNVTIDTKVYPVEPGTHAPEKLESTFKTSLETLGRDNVRVLYLHAPDRSVPFGDTVKKIDELHKQGLFDIFGLSNFAAWEVAEVVGVARANNWIVPGIYQAMYNGITRAIEPELVPCLRKYKIRLVIYNPLAGGFFAGKIAGLTSEVEKGARFDPNTRVGKMYRERYIQGNYFKALELVKNAADKSGLRLTEVALRWVQHHSVLEPGDGVILGASSVQQLEQNITDSEKGPLDQDVLDAMDAAWAAVGSSCPPYWR